MSLVMHGLRNTLGVRPQHGVRRSSVTVSLAALFGVLLLAVAAPVQAERAIGQRFVANTNGDIAHVINCCCFKATEVSRLWKRNVNELIEKTIHSCTTERYLVSDDFPLAKLKRCNRLLCWSW